MNSVYFPFKGAIYSGAALRLGTHASLAACIARERQTDRRMVGLMGEDRAGQESSGQERRGQVRTGQGRTFKRVLKDIKAEPLSTFTGFLNGF